LALCQPLGGGRLGRGSTLPDLVENALQRHETALQLGGCVRVRLARALLLIVADEQNRMLAQGLIAELRYPQLSIE
jgi:hypothetical protein